MSDPYKYRLVPRLSRRSSGSQPWSVFLRPLRHLRPNLPPHHHHHRLCSAHETPKYSVCSAASLGNGRSSNQSHQSRNQHHGGSRNPRSSRSHPQTSSRRRRRRNGNLSGSWNGGQMPSACCERSALRTPRRLSGGPTARSNSSRLSSRNYSLRSYEPWSKSRSRQMSSTSVLAPLRISNSFLEGMPFSFSQTARSAMQLWNPVTSRQAVDGRERLVITAYKPLPSSRPCSPCSLRSRRRRHCGKP
jgi:hypothetical protein